MSATNNDKSAFPHDAGLINTGMELRDYFAAKALASFLINKPPSLEDEPAIFWAKDAYDMADAMMKARAL